VLKNPRRPLEAQKSVTYFGRERPDRGIFETAADFKNV
jgi:hypothetical protein